jgi:spore coat polysaccharide biosynthesis predicted glycosyltransferase SpsG
MGGTDQGNATGRALDALTLCQLPADCRIMAAMGRHSPWLDIVGRQAMGLPFPCDLRVDVLNMAKLMAESDLCIGAMGGTAWERCCLGLPAIAVVIAENQRDGAVRLAQEGAISLVRDADALLAELPRQLAEIQWEGRLVAMSRAASRLVDGEGAGRVVDAVLGGTS